MTKLLLASLWCLPVLAQVAQSILRRAIADFQSARILESVRGFDEVVKLRPDAAPQLWQRGIALYYAEHYQDCGTRKVGFWRLSLIARRRSSENEYSFGVRQGSGELFGAGPDDST